MQYGTIRYGRLSVCSEQLTGGQHTEPLIYHTEPQTEH